MTKIGLVLRRANRQDERVVFSLEQLPADMDDLAEALDNAQEDGMEAIEDGDDTCRIVAWWAE